VSFFCKKLINLYQILIKFSINLENTKNLVFKVQFGISGNCKIQRLQRICAVVAIGHRFAHNDKLLFLGNRTLNVSFQRDNHSDKELKEIYNLKNIAVVGMSTSPAKPGHFVPKYLLDLGYNIIPVNPNAAEILGRRSYYKVSEISEQVDIVNIFRKSEDVYPIVQDAILKNGVKVLWLQEGIHNEEAERLARDIGIEVLYNRCMMAEHRRLFS
jgi:uncharacterized protein